MKLPYLVAIKTPTGEKDVYEFPDEKSREGFIEEINTKFPELQWIKTVVK